MVRDHGDEFGIGGFSLDAADGVAEELLRSREPMDWRIRWLAYARFPTSVQAIPEGELRVKGVNPMNVALFF